MENENNCPVAEQIEGEGASIQIEYDIAPDGIVAPKEEMTNCPGNPQ